MRLLLAFLSLLVCRCFRHPVRLAFDRQQLQRTRAFNPLDRILQQPLLDRLFVSSNGTALNISVPTTINTPVTETVPREQKPSFFSRIQAFLSPVSKAASSGLSRLYSKKQVPEIVPATLTMKLIEEYADLQEEAHHHTPSDSEDTDGHHMSLGQRLGQLVGWHRDSDNNAAHASSANAVQEQLNKLACSAALAINSTADARDFAAAIGFDVLIDQLQSPTSLKLDILQALQNAVKHLPEYGVDLVQSKILLEVLCDWMEAPYKGLFAFRPRAEQQAAFVLQREAVQFIQRLVRNNGITVDLLKGHSRLIAVLNQMALQSDSESQSSRSPSVDGGDASDDTGHQHPHQVEQQQLQPVLPVHTHNRQKTTNAATSIPVVSAIAKRRPSIPLIGRTVITDYVNLTTSQMARVAAWGIGGVPWRPRQPHQKGLRILSFDGGGTKGVLSAAMLSELWTQLGYDERHTKPCDVFDVICGTSTGGILAALYGLQQKSLSDTEQLYASFVDKIFDSRSHYGLARNMAYYREKEFEHILHDFCGEQLLVDSNQQAQVPRVFCVSTKMNDGTAAGKPHLWRNYNYPPGVHSKYSGSCFANTYTAIRATTAAPTFFTPVIWRDGLFVDGAMLANNPTAIAVQEAKVLYPGVPIELVVSIGTGSSQSGDTSLNYTWKRVASQILGRATSPEDVHDMLTHFLPSASYYRFNPALRRHFTIDEKEKLTLEELKQEGRDYITKYVSGNSERFQDLLKMMRGNNYK